MDDPIMKMCWRDSGRHRSGADGPLCYGDADISHWHGFASVELPSESTANEPTDSITTARIEWV